MTPEIPRPSPEMQGAPGGEQLMHREEIQPGAVVKYQGREWLIMEVRPDQAYGVTLRKVLRRDDEQGVVSLGTQRVGVKSGWLEGEGEKVNVSPLLQQKAQALVVGASTGGPAPATPPPRREAGSPVPTDSEEEESHDEEGPVGGS